MKKAIILLIVSFLCGTASAQTRTELIRSIKERLSMCSGVSNIETAGSNFRAYINTPMQGVYEFDLDALRKPFSSDGVVDINCASSACVSTKGAVSGQWRELAKSARVPIMCMTYGAEVNGFLAVYVSQFGSGQ
ncbi:hypothetical protein [Variovorax gossypii]